MGLSVGRQEPLSSLLPQTSEKAPSGKVGDLTEKSSNLGKWLYCLPWKAQKAMFQCSSLLA